MEFKCGACGREQKYEPRHGHPEAMPGGWRMHEIQGHKVLLCDSCGNPGHFHGGLSPHLGSLLRARGIPVKDVQSTERPKGRRGHEWGEVDLVHDGRRYAGTYVVEKGMLTLTYKAFNRVMRKSAHVNGPGPHDWLARILLSEFVIPESRARKEIGPDRGTP